MTKQIEGVPEGWELVGIRKAKKGEFSVGGGEGGLPRVWDSDSASVYPIVRKSLKVEIGKYYRRIDGNIVGPMQHGSPYGDYPFQVAGRYWNEAGVRRWAEDREKQNLVEEVPAPEPPRPEYRPFANAAEFKPHRDKWIKRDGAATAEGCFKVSGYSEAGVHVLDAGLVKYAKLLEWKFEDGTLCGVKQ